MDVGSLVSWIQLTLWGIAAVVFLIRVLRGEINIHPLVSRIASSNGLIGFVISSVWLCPPFRSI
jgi:hypothetical protein